MAARDLYEKDFYKILGVSKNAPADEIKKKYRSLARELHPDKNKGDVKLEEQFKAVKITRYYGVTRRNDIVVNFHFTNNQLRII